MIVSPFLTLRWNTFSSHLRKRYQHSFKTVSVSIQNVFGGKGVVLCLENCKNTEYTKIFNFYIVVSGLASTDKRDHNTKCVMMQCNVQRK